VVPFVEDSRNCLLFEPEIALEHAEMASLQAALKRAIEARFQLENSEMAAEPLPNPGKRRILLLYEAAEGGAGVLHRLLDEPGILAESPVPHWTSAILTLIPAGPGPRTRARENCEAACYDCLAELWQPARTCSVGPPDHRRCSAEPGPV
jgi:hypothetical protein